jgi:transposase-like protein
MAENIEDFKERTPEEIEKERVENEKHEKGRIRLLNNLASGDLSRIKDRVAFILNTNPKARNSDAELAWGYWQAFEKEGFDGGDL